MGTDGSFLNDDENNSFAISAGRDTHFGLAPEVQKVAKIQAIDTMALYLVDAQV